MDFVRRILCDEPRRSEESGKEQAAHDEVTRTHVPS
jgi:hypothetical protein